MKVEFFQSLPSTQEFLIDALKNGEIKPPHMIVAHNQTKGVGSRGNSWEGLGGNLFMSFCISEDELPSDIPPPSISIYFSMLMREVLSKLGSKCWLKWPNDFYVDDRKIGGTLTNKVDEIYICGMGINLASAPENAGILDIKTSVNELVWGFVSMLDKKILWKPIFSKFRIDFCKSKSFITHIANRAVSLQDAEICEDGAILLNGEKVYSLR